MTSDLNISVVIPLYNKEKQVGRTLESVLAQTFQDFEVVIVDDGSTDGSAEVVKTFDDPRIRLIRQANAGVSAARNRGIDAARYDYIALLDADDLWEPEYLETQVNLIKEYSECDVFATNYKFMDVYGNSFPTILNKLKIKRGILDNYFEVATHSHPPICSISIVAKKETFKGIGGFPTNIKSGEDLLTWARLACRNKIAYSTETLAIYNLGEGYEYGNEPVRRQDKGDPVGKALNKLLIENPDIPYLRRYIGHWHKMRASVAIRFGERKETLQECFISLKYYPTNTKIFPFIILSIIPSFIRKRIIAFKKHS